MHLRLRGRPTGILGIHPSTLRALHAGRRKRTPRLLVKVKVRDIETGRALWGMVLVGDDISQGRRGEEMRVLVIVIGEDWLRPCAVRGCIEDAGVPFLREWGAV